MDLTTKQVATEALKKKVQVKSNYGLLDGLSVDLPFIKSFIIPFSQQSWFREAERQMPLQVEPRVKASIKGVKINGPIHKLVNSLNDIRNSIEAIQMVAEFDLTSEPYRGKNEGKIAFRVDNIPESDLVRPGKKKQAVFDEKLFDKSHLAECVSFIGKEGYKLRQINGTSRDEMKFIADAFSAILELEKFKPGPSR